jgi:four helix bundle protein
MADWRLADQTAMAYRLQFASGMNTKAEVLKARTKRFALDVLELIDTLPAQGPSVRIGWQLGAAATSTAANYRAACRARSPAEFAAKIGLVLEEADESLFWLEVLLERETGDPALRKALLAEADQLTAIFAASTITARATASRAREARVADEPITGDPIRKLKSAT